MNYIKHLTGFFEKVAQDKLLNPTHISLYIALFQFWNLNRFRNPISISRNELMRISKISSLATYHKCLKQLDSQSYIKYEPSFNPYKGSHVYLFDFAEDLKPVARSQRSAAPNFKPFAEQVLNTQQQGTETGKEQLTEQALIPYINSTNNLKIKKRVNDLNFAENSNKTGEPNLYSENNDEQKEKKSSAKKKEKDFAEPGASKMENTGNIQEEVPIVQSKHSTPIYADNRAFESWQSNMDVQPPLIPSIEEVLKYFAMESYPDLEANKFFNYFQSIGWLVGGKIPMTNWTAAARNWMLNASKFSVNERPDRAKSLDTSPQKNYAEPL